MIENLTNEVKLTDKTLFLIRIDGKEKVIIEGKDEAVLVLDSLAQAECNKLQSEWVRVFRRDQTDGMKVSISTQSQGILVNGFVSTVRRLDCIPVQCAYLIRGRHELKKTLKEELGDAIRLRREKISSPPLSPTKSVPNKISIKPELSKLLETIYNKDVE